MRVRMPARLRVHAASTDDGMLIFADRDVKAGDSLSHSTHTFRVICFFFFTTGGGNITVTLAACFL